MKLNPRDRADILSKSPLLIGILAATVIFIVSILIIEQQRDIKTTRLRLELSGEVKRISLHINDFLDDMYSGIAATTRMVNDGGMVTGFDEGAKSIIHSNTRLNNLSLIPGGIIKYTYPEKNRGAINSNILYSENREEAAAALESFKTKKVKISGPFRNFENVPCIAARLPIFIQGKFWGFSSAVVRLDSILQKSGLNAPDAKYSYSLSYRSFLNGREVFFVGAKPSSREIAVTEEMSHINWNLYVSAKSSSLQLFYIPALLALAGSAGIGFLIRRWLETTARLQRLIFLKDQQIAHSEREFKAIFEHAPIGFAIVDLTTKNILGVNEKFRKIFNASSAEASSSLHRSWEHTISGVLDQLPEGGNGQQHQVSGEYKHINGNEEEIWTNYKLFPLPSASNTDRKYVVIAEDVTEKLAAERKIKHSERKYRCLFDESPVALWEEDFSDVVRELTRNGLVGQPAAEVYAYFDKQPELLSHYMSLVKIKSINDECFKQYGYSNKEELFANFHRTAAEQSNLIVIQKTLVAICTGQQKFKSESAFYNAEGELRSSILSWQVIPGHEDLYDQVILTTVDITDLKRSKEDLNKSMEILDHQNKRLLDFSYIVSHNLRSHTSNIQSLSELLLVSDSEKERTELTNHLHGVVNILASTIEALNDVVSINADLNLTQQQIPLREVADKTIHVLRNKIKQKEGVVLNNIPKETTIFHNKAYIESILLNLISNSLKYSKPNVCPIVTLNFTEEHSEKVLIVSDNGIGIDLEKYSHKLFGLFKTFTHNPESRGVGLYITKRQIEALGGRITVDSAVNIGTTFKIYFK
ncbi:ATP-binding protein [Niabella insulamsoli]|uniref:ATP-binding protein n=1 Tax=Niabella insulamsoli TaxID=3144874 RepID=UPI0031FE06DD